ncbi:uncharacterized protein K02A2.6-like [Olea europaea var. sylvestris]|uniref:uncharacterized protein K02A2.6-like n=1 Tax=Olea europaea var. sylvestris TaxID=158386 RepID=UPI000C1D2E09|nr:uncharacterized protein K02A2.6-like [Olea europaea var. sylvestris]
MKSILSRVHASAYGGYFGLTKTASKVDFIGHFPSSYNNRYILVAVDYVFKWVKAKALPINDARVVVDFIKKYIFNRYGSSKAIISDGATHFRNWLFQAVLHKYGIQYRIATPYHPQTSGQVETLNRQLKRILELTVNASHKDWSTKLDDALWAHRPAYKTPFECPHIDYSLENPAIYQWNLSTEHTRH